MKVQVINAEWRREAFSRSPIGFKYRLVTGPRCTGLLSQRTYESWGSAEAAGNRMAKKLKELPND